MGRAMGRAMLSISERQQSLRSIIFGHILAFVDVVMFVGCFKIVIQVFHNDKGNLLLSLSYDSVTIKGLILKAANLKKQDIIGLAGL